MLEESKGDKAIAPKVPKETPSCRESQRSESTAIRVVFFFFFFVLSSHDSFLLCNAECMVMPMEDRTSPHLFFRYRSGPIQLLFKKATHFFCVTPSVHMCLLMKCPVRRSVDSLGRCMVCIVLCGVVHLMKELFWPMVCLVCRGVPLPIVHVPFLGPSLLSPIRRPSTQTHNCLSVCLLSCLGPRTSL